MTTDLGWPEKVIQQQGDCDLVLVGKLFQQLPGFQNVVPDPELLVTELIHLASGADKAK